MPPRKPLRMLPACSISRRATRSSSLPKYGWTFMLSSRPETQSCGRDSLPCGCRRRGKTAPPTGDFAASMKPLRCAPADFRRNFHVAKKISKSNVLTYTPKKHAATTDKAIQNGSGVPRQDDRQVMALELPPAKLSPAMEAYFKKCQEKLGFVPNVLLAY